MSANARLYVAVKHHTGLVRTALMHAFRTPCSGAYVLAGEEHPYCSGHKGDSGPLECQARDSQSPAVLVHWGQRHRLGIYGASFTKKYNMLLRSRILLHLANHSEWPSLTCGSSSHAHGMP